MQKYLSMFGVAVLGAVAATLCDAVHVYTGTLSYPEPNFYGQAYPVFPGFVLAFLVMAFSYHFAFSRLPLAHGASYQPGDGNSAVTAFVLFIVVYMLSGFGHQSPMMLNAIFYGLFLVRLAFTYERGFMLLLAIVLGIGGILGEGFLSSIGYVAYSMPEVYHVPVWLGGLYMHGAFALRELMRWLVYR